LTAKSNFYGIALGDPMLLVWLYGFGIDEGLGYFGKFD